MGEGELGILRTVISSPNFLKPFSPINFEIATISLKKTFSLVNTPILETVIQIELGVSNGKVKWKKEFNQIMVISRLLCYQAIRRLL